MTAGLSTFTWIDARTWIFPDTVRPDVKCLENIRKTDSPTIKLNVFHTALKGLAGRLDTLSIETFKLMLSDFDTLLRYLFSY